MNERLRELAMLANIEFTYDPTETPIKAFAECWEDELEKFAELIVKECVTVMYDNAIERKVPPDIDKTPTHYAKAVLEHFGVEE
jgi:hypothetical protein